MSEVSDAADSASVDSRASSAMPDQAFKAQLQRFAYSPSIVSRSLASQELSESRVASLRRKPPLLPPTNVQGPNKSDKSISRKRLVDSESGLYSGASTPKKRRTTARERSANDPHNPANKLVDSMRPGLILVFVGLNPGLTTALTGHAYAHHSNRFWHLLEASGVTPVKHKPSETHDLMDLYSIGNTNICARPTRDGSSLTKEELRDGASILEKKIQEMRPQAVAIVGKQIWEALWRAKKGKALDKAEFKWGWQDEHAWLGSITDGEGVVVWKGAQTFVTTSTSGLSATLSPAEKLAIWKPLGEWFTARREASGPDSVV